MTPLDCLIRIRDGHRQAAAAWREYADEIDIVGYPIRLAAANGMRAEAAVCDALADKAQLAIDVLEGKGE